MYLTPNHHFMIRHDAAGRGSNMREELMALFSLLHFTRSKQVMGYSKVAIDMANKKIRIEIFRLQHLLQEIRSDIQAFQWTYFVHVCRELNVKTDEMSKEALLMVPGTFTFTKYIDGEEVDGMSFHLH